MYFGLSFANDGELTEAGAGKIDGDRKDTTLLSLLTFFPLADGILGLGKHEFDGEVFYERMTVPPNSNTMQ